jgi:hypothetical protein
LAGFEQAAWKVTLAMHLSAMDLFFWAAGFIVHLVLLFVLFYRHRARAFPFFTSLILLSAVRTVVLYLVLHYGSKDGYYYTFWSLAVLDVVAQLGVVYEVASRVFRPLDVWAPDVRGNFLWLLNLSTTVALVLAWAESPVVHTRIQALVARGNLFAAALESEILVAMMALSVTARLPWKTHVARIAQGLGIYSLISVLFETSRSYAGVSRLLPSFSVLSHVRMVAYLGCVGWWIASLYLPEREARTMTAEMREKIFALGSQVAYDLQDLQSRKRL